MLINIIELGSEHGSRLDITPATALCSAVVDLERTSLGLNRSKPETH